MYDYLNTDLNREMSKLLHEIRCISESDKLYSGLTGKLITIFDYARYDAIPAFTFEDVIRKENAIKVWGDSLLWVCSCGHVGPSRRDKSGWPENDHECDDDASSGHEMSAWWTGSNHIVNLFQSGEDWQQYVIDSLKKNL